MLLAPSVSVALIRRALTPHPSCTMPTSSSRRTGMSLRKASVTMASVDGPSPSRSASAARRSRMLATSACPSPREPASYERVDEADGRSPSLESHRFDFVGKQYIVPTMRPAPRVLPRVKRWPIGSGARARHALRRGPATCHLRGARSGLPAVQRRHCAQPSQQCFEKALVEARYLIGGPFLRGPRSTSSLING